MDVSLLDLLQCPFCGSRLTILNFDAGSREIIYGVLRCNCGEYPVIEGIPVLKKGVIGTEGQTVEHIVTLIKSGRKEQALLALLSPVYPKLLFRKARVLDRVPIVRRLPRLMHDRSLRFWKIKTLDLVSRPTIYNACDFLRHYYLNTNVPNYWYFAYRFSNGKYLVGLSLAFSLLGDQLSKKPILDLACGGGALTWVLQQCVPHNQVIGIDNSFPFLCVAKKWSATNAMFVCCAADVSLPFHDEAFSAIFCSDAFHYLEHKTTCAAELRRVKEAEGTIALFWMRNRLIEHPYKGMALSPAGYETLISDMPHRLIADRDILTRYLQKLGPPLAYSAANDRLDGEPVVTLIASHREGIFKDYGTFADWPHAKGRLSLNPLYAKMGSNGNDETFFRRTFPSAEYEELNSECKEYLPKEIALSRTALISLSRGLQTPELHRLIDQFAVLGMPERYGQALSKNVLGFLAFLEGHGEQIILPEFSFSSAKVFFAALKVCAF